jgi:hypothetical protein
VIGGGTSVGEVTWEPAESFSSVVEEILAEFRELGAELPEILDVKRQSERRKKPTRHM